MTYLSFLQPSIDLPEVFGEELFSNGLSVDSNSLSDLDQMWGTAKTGVFSHFSLAKHKEINTMVMCINRNVNLVIFLVLNVIDYF